jgi:anti-anti-sigma factor
MRVEVVKSTGGHFEAKLTERMAFSDHGAFRSLLQAIANAGAKTCMLDLSGLVAIDSAGLGMFMIARDEARKGGWSLTVRCPAGRVRSLLELSKFDKLITIEA